MFWQSTEVEWGTSGPVKLYLCCWWEDVHQWEQILMRFWCCLRLCQLMFLCSGSCWSVLQSSLCLSVCLCVCMSVCMGICLWTLLGVQPSSRPPARPRPRPSPRLSRSPLTLVLSDKVLNSELLIKYSFTVSQKQKEFWNIYVSACQSDTFAGSPLVG